MKTINGWAVYMKIKEMSGTDESEKPHITIDDLMMELGLKQHLMEEYLTALAKLDFITYTDHTKTAFVITDLNR